MLELFSRISKVGLFEDYTHASGCEIGEVTLIYGENGVGKSTLAAILDSLRERNAPEIIRRRSLPGDVSPSVVVRVNAKDYTFSGNDWNDSLPHDTLDIFYPGFVTRNVHASTGVDAEHRRNLCELVLGHEAVEKIASLASADNEGRAALADLKVIDKQLELLIKKPDTLATFPGLPNDPDIDRKIDQVRTELKDAQSKEAILKRMVPKEIPPPVLPREVFVHYLESSSDVIAASVGAIVNAHIKEHLDAAGETWLKYGSDHIDADGICPFCAQDTTSSELVSAIRSYFSAEYKKYNDSLSEEASHIQTIYGSAVFKNIRSDITSQIAAAAQWMDMAPIDHSSLAAMLDKAELLWKSAAAKMGPLVAKKEAKPLVSLDPHLAEESLGDYEQSIAVLVTLNETLAICIKQIGDKMAMLSKADITEIESRLHRLENQKSRFEPAAQDLLAKKNTLIELRGAIDARKTRLKDEIDSVATKVVGKYQTGINHYLTHFGCDIRMESVEPRFPSGKASVQYVLKAHGHAIELGVSETGPCFETVLSDGDKYTLALSFFFASLMDSTNLTGRTVVLDDPVNSLGISRRTLIEGVIREVRLKGAQVVVLTHDERLAAMMWRDNKLKDIATLQIERTRTGSRLKQWDVERATQSEYVVDYLTLTNYLDNGGDHKNPAGCIRPYVEQRLRHLFPGPPFETRDTLGQMIAKIRNSASGTRLHVLTSKLTELVAINEAALPSHHATDDVPGMTPLTPDGVRLFARKALDVLG